MAPLLMFSCLSFLVLITVSFFPSAYMVSLKKKKGKKIKTLLLRLYKFLRRDLLWRVCLPPSFVPPRLHLCREFSLPTVSPAVRSIQEISSLGIRTGTIGTSLVVQWPRLCAPNAGGSSLIPGQGTRPHMPQLRVRMLQLKIPCATTKIQHSQINK